MIELASTSFIPIAENCSPLQSQQDAKGAFFRLVAEQGHYAGRTYPTGTRQGYYAFTAGGTLLGAMNSRDPERMKEMMRTALRRWETLSDDGHAGHPGTSPEAIDILVPDYVPARPNPFPADGLVLRLVARDLPREVDTRNDDWRTHAWNLDYAWFTAGEAGAMMPQARIIGATGTAPRSLLRRLARFHLRDFVRGEPPAWPVDALRRAELTTEVVALTGSLVTLRLCGYASLESEHRWVRPEDGEARRSPSGFDATFAGEATWDDALGRFIAFELLATGPRWGTAQYNNRADDLGPAPLGIAFTLAGHEPRDRTPPHQINHRNYFAT